MGRARRERRQADLEHLGYRDYDKYLKAPHWQGVRAKYAASNQPQDCICGETEGLQLHHLTYERLGAEELWDVTPLCKRCHAMIHALEARGEMGLDFSGLVDAERAALYKIAQRKRHQERFAESDLERLDSAENLKWRDRMGRLKNLMRDMRKRGIDRTDLYEVLDQQIFLWQRELGIIAPEATNRRAA